MTPEGLILDACKRMLKSLELQGKVTHWERINVGAYRNMQGHVMRQGNVGTSDVIAFVPVDKTMWVMFFEVKRPDGGRQSPEQLEFESKFKGYDNVIYSVITDAKQIKQLVMQARSNIKDLSKIPYIELDI